MREDIVIIGAPRSGTNMLRNVLTRLPGTTTWPCDEINYIWRHGNIRYPSDEFSEDMATTRIKWYIQREFDRVARRYNSNRVIEKTCANSLRVGFVHRILPEAKFVFIYRNGLDVVASAMKRWCAPLDINYIYKKARYVPVLDLPYYASSYLLNRVHKVFSRERRLSVWGPRMDKLPMLLENHSLSEICALQWKRCVDSAEEQLANVPPNCVARIRYEDFVENPSEELHRVLADLEIEASTQEIREATSIVSTSSVGKGRVALPKDDIECLNSLIADTMTRCGY